MNDTKRFRAKVKGRVQGIGYRFFAQQTAVTMHLSGFVQNQSDGTVLVEAQGASSELQKFSESLKQGPRLAVIESVALEWIETEPQSHEFLIRF